MRFPTNQCPLCNKIMKFRHSHGVTTYYCPTEAKSHYEVETDGKQTIQHIYAFPYAIDNCANSTKSRVFKWTGTRWGFIKELPEIGACEQSKLLSFLKSTVPLGTPYPSAL